MLLRNGQGYSYHSLTDKEEQGDCGETKLEIKKQTFSKEDFQQMRELLSRISTSSSSARLWITAKNIWKNLGGWKQLFAGSGGVLTAVAPVCLYYTIQWKKRHDDYSLLAQCETEYQFTEGPCGHDAYNATDPCNQYYSTWCDSFNQYCFFLVFTVLSGMGAVIGDIYTIDQCLHLSRTGAILTLQDFLRSGDAELLSRVGINTNLFISEGEKTLGSLMDCASEMAEALSEKYLWEIIKGYLEPCSDVMTPARVIRIKDEAKTELLYLNKGSPSDVKEEVKKDDEEAESLKKQFSSIRTVVKGSNDTVFLNRSVELVERAEILDAKADLYLEKLGAYAQPAATISSSNWKQSQAVTDVMVEAAKSLPLVSLFKKKIHSFAVNSRRELKDDYSHLRNIANNEGQVSLNEGALILINVISKTQSR